LLYRHTTSRWQSNYSRNAYKWCPVIGKPGSARQNRRDEPHGTLRWGWIFLERTRILSGIQFTTHFIEIFVVETKQFVGSTVNVILTRQTCSQRSSRAAESKRRALGNYFFERIYYIMFLISKCRGDRDLCLCTTSGLAFGEPMRSGVFRGKNVFRHRKNRVLLLRCGTIKKVESPFAFILNAKD